MNKKSEPSRRMGSDPNLEMSGPSAPEATTGGKEKGEEGGEQGEEERREAGEQMEGKTKGGRRERGKEGDE